MSLSKMFLVDKQIEQQGAKIPLPANEDGSIPVFYVARAGKTNSRWQRAWDKATAPYRRDIELRMLKQEKAFEIDVSIFVKGCLTGWENILNSDVGIEGEGFAPFNETNATMLFNRMPELYTYLHGQANTLSNYTERALEDEAKN